MEIHGGCRIPVGVGLRLRPTTSTFGAATKSCIRDVVATITIQAQILLNLIGAKAFLP